LHFPGTTVADFERSWHERTVFPSSGQQGARKTLSSQLRQQRRSLVGHPSEQVRSWMHGRWRRALQGGEKQPEHAPVR
ncbi:MAG: hypothetical protein HY534_00315, partial [Chloroflexi bacterium]|nr:hypothetical protein [Chloroflexota bacterium]